MPEGKVVYDCPLQHRGYTAGVHKVCPHCGETEKHPGLVAPEPPAPEPKPSKMSRLKRKK